MLAIVAAGVLLLMVDRPGRAPVPKDDVPVVWSRRQTIGFRVELGLAGVYLILSALLGLFAGGWHMPADRQVWLVLLVVAYVVAGIYALVQSNAKWKRGLRAGYWFPLLIPLSTLALLVGVNLLRPPLAFDPSVSEEIDFALEACESERFGPSGLRETCAVASGDQRLAGQWESTHIIREQAGVVGYDRSVVLITTSQGAWEGPVSVDIDSSGGSFWGILEGSGGHSGLRLQISDEKNGPNGECSLVDADLGVPLPACYAHAAWILAFSD